MSRHTVLLLAGEPSGDLHAGALAAELARRRPDLRLVGTGGARMKAAGVELLAGLDDLAVMGFAEVVTKLGALRAIERRLKRRVEEGDVALMILVDYPGLNLRMARWGKRAGIPVLYYIAPKAWAWRPARARRLAEHTDRVAVVLPFEVDFLTGFGVQAAFVGHPLLDRPDDVVSDEEFRARWRLSSGRPLLALLPGSRNQEIAKHLDLFVDAAERVRAVHPGIQPVVGRASNLPAEIFSRVGYPVVDDVRALLRHARAALLKSGTVTLEAAIEGTPGVVAYRTSALTWAVARRLLRVEHVSLPNLVAGARVVPELLQSNATPERLAEALLPIVDVDARERCLQVEGLALLRSALGDRGATGRVADLALDLLKVTG